MIGVRKFHRYWVAEGLCSQHKDLIRTFLLERKVPKETAFLQACKAWLYSDYSELMSSRPGSCNPPLVDKAYPFLRDVSSVH